MQFSKKKKIAIFLSTQRQHNKNLVLICPKKKKQEPSFAIAIHNTQWFNFFRVKMLNNLQFSYQHIRHNVTRTKFCNNTLRQRFREVPFSLTAELRTACLSILFFRSCFTFSRSSSSSSASRIAAFASRLLLSLLPTRPTARNVLMKPRDSSRLFHDRDGVWFLMFAEHAIWLFLEEVDEERLEEMNEFRAEGQRSDFAIVQFFYLALLEDWFMVLDDDKVSLATLVALYCFPPIIHFSPRHGVRFNTVNLVWMIRVFVNWEIGWFGFLKAIPN